MAKHVPSELAVTTKSGCVAKVRSPSASSEMDAWG